MRTFRPFIQLGFILLTLLAIWAGWKYLRGDLSSRRREHTGQGNDVVEQDFNGDGVADVLYYYSNDVSIKLQMDRNFDGIMDYLEYYSNGIPYRSLADDSFRGMPDQSIDYKWGQPFIAREDTDSNGIPDITHYFSNGIVALVIYQPNATGSVARETRFVAGRISEDVFYNAFSNTILRLRYDSYGRMVNWPEKVQDEKGYR